MTVGAGSITNAARDAYFAKKIKKAASMLLETALAEEERFELPVPFSTTVFKTAPLNHSGTPPYSISYYQKRPQR